MTEDQARTKWCPFARVAAPMAFTQPGSTREDWIGVAGANRGALSERVAVHTEGDASNPASARCIASACMAWRWAWEEQDYGARQMNFPRERSTTEGGCGLAGAPQ